MSTMNMRVAMALGGTDMGLSGIGVFTRMVLPRLAARARGKLLVLGTRRELDAYAGELAGVEPVLVPGGAMADEPAVSAAWYLARAGARARAAGADVLLLPAGNRRLTARSPIPTVAVVHDLAQLRVRRKYDRLRMLYARRVVVAVLRSATVLVAVSQTTRTHLAQAANISPKRVRVVTNGVEHQRFSPELATSGVVAQARARHGLEQPYVLYAARLEHPGKNHLRLIRAFAASTARTSHQLLLIGRDWGARELIEHQLHALGIEDRVRVMGFVDDDALPPLFAGADAVAMVGLCEGFGLPVIEALAAGTPVLAARAGALPEVAGPLAAFCDPFDEQSIRAALDRIVADEDLRARARRDGPAWAAQFDWDTTAAGLWAACQEALAS